MRKPVVFFEFAGGDCCANFLNLTPTQINKFCAESKRRFTRVEEATLDHWMEATGLPLENFANVYEFNMYNASKVDVVELDQLLRDVGVTNTVDYRIAYTPQELIFS